MNKGILATAALAAVALTSCSNTQEPATPSKGQVVAPATVTAAKYTDPRDMRARSGLSFTDCSEGTTRNVNNALSQLCNLPSGETVGFYTFETETAGLATANSLVRQGSFIYQDTGWIVSAKTQATIERARVALTQP